MTRTEVNDIKAKMLDDLLDALGDDNTSSEELREMVTNMRYASGLFEMMFDKQTELLKKNGYMGA